MTALSSLICLKWPQQWHSSLSPGGNYSIIKCTSLWRNVCLPLLQESQISTLNVPLPLLIMLASIWRSVLLIVSSFPYANKMEASHLFPSSVFINTFQAWSSLPDSSCFLRHQYYPKREYILRKEEWNDNHNNDEVISQRSKQILQIFVQL